jgi:hypothetical protein
MLIAIEYGSSPVEAAQLQSLTLPLPAFLAA